jgi:bifunctional pyridoxal-dependent enzyme with beta-cystathionase and maltose regulon repressor activities
MRDILNSSSNFFLWDIMHLEILHCKILVLSPSNYYQMASIKREPLVIKKENVRNDFISRKKHEKMKLVN